MAKLTNEEKEMRNRFQNSLLPYERLAAAVIKTAVEDLEEGVETYDSLREWFSTPVASLICGAAGLDAQDMGETILREHKSGTPLAKGWC